MQPSIQFCANRRFLCRFIEWVKTYGHLLLRIFFLKSPFIKSLGNSSLARRPQQILTTLPNSEFHADSNSTLGVPVRFFEFFRMLDPFPFIRVILSKIALSVGVRNFLTFSIVLHVLVLSRNLRVKDPNQTYRWTPQTMLIHTIPMADLDVEFSILVRDHISHKSIILHRFQLN